MNKPHLFLLLFVPVFFGCPVDPCGPECGIVLPDEVPEPTSIYDDTCWGKSFEDATPSSTPEAASCIAQLRIDETFPLIGQLGEMQIHLDAAFDGSQLHLVYNYADSGTDGIGVAGRTLACDGTLGEEVQISGGPLTQTEPNAAWSGDRLLVAWQRDDPEQSPNNLSTHYHIVDANWNPLFETERTLTMTRNGIEQTKNVWMPVILPAFQQGFWVIGARGHDAATVFQSFAQLVGGSGGLLCDSIDLNLQPEIGQVYPAAAANRGQVLMAWESHQPGGGEIEFAQSAKGFLHTATTEITNSSGDAERPAVALSPNGENAAIAYHISVGTTLRTYLIDPTQPTTPLAVGNSGENAHSPAVALGENGGVVFWLEIVSGTKNRAYHQTFQRVDGGYELVGSPQAVGDDAVLPYPILVQHLSADSYFLGWMAGNYPNYQAFGRFILPAELQ